MCKEMLWGRKANGILCSRIEERVPCSKESVFISIALNVLSTRSFQGFREVSHPEGSCSFKCVEIVEHLQVFLHKHSMFKEAPER